MVVGFSVLGASVAGKAVAAAFERQRWANDRGLDDVVLLSSQPPDCNLGEIVDCPDAAFEDQMKAIVLGPLRLMRARAAAPRLVLPQGSTTAAGRYSRPSTYTWPGSRSPGRTTTTPSSTPASDRSPGRSGTTSF